MRGRRTDVVEVVGAMVDAAAVGEWLSQALLQKKMHRLAQYTH